MTRTISCAFLVATSAASHAIQFDFESAPPAGTYTSVSQTVDGVTATATGVGSDVLVYTFGSGYPNFAGFGQRSLAGAKLDPEDPVFNLVPLRIDFSTQVSFVSAQVGDGGGDDDGTVTLSGYSSGGDLLAQTSGFYGTSDAPLTLTMSASGIAYIVGQTSAASFTNTLVWDNIIVTPVPEPGSSIVLVSALAWFARRKRSTGR